MKKLLAKLRGAMVRVTSLYVVQPAKGFGPAVWCHSAARAQLVAYATPGNVVHVYDAFLGRRAKTPLLRITR